MERLNCCTAKRNGLPYHSSVHCPGPTVERVIRIKDGVIWESVIVDLADRIAQVNGFHYAESFVRHYNNHELCLDANLKIVPRVNGVQKIV